MFQDVRYACRALVRSRAYASATIVTLALGLGVNTAVATIVWSVLFRPLPIVDSDRVVLVYPADPTFEHLRQPISYQTFQEWRRRNTVFDELAGDRADRAHAFDRERSRRRRGGGERQFLSSSRDSPSRRPAA